MITIDDIRPYRAKAIDFDETERLKKQLYSLKQIRKPFYLNSDDFEQILRWKLRQQYGRVKHLTCKNTVEVIHDITAVAFSIKHKDNDYLLDLRIKLLTVLKGVEIPVASAILALCFPEQYAVIDFRGWRQIFGEGKHSFTLNEYKRYLKEIKGLANELGWLPQEVDLAIWAYDSVNSIR